MTYTLGFKYLFFEDIDHHGAVIGRKEKIVSKERKDLDGLYVFRFIEIVPRNIEIWKGEEDDAFAKFLKGILNWARKENCIAADFSALIYILFIICLDIKVTYSAFLR